MIIKTEIYEGCAYLLDDFGQVWEVHIDYDRQPSIRLVTRFDRIEANRIMEPQLGRFAHR